MKLKISFLIICMLFITSITFSTALTQNELVRGFYDPVNDWFVFEWDRPEYGKTMTVYDPPNKIEPDIRAFLNFNAELNEYRYSYEVSNYKEAVQPLYIIQIKHLMGIYNATQPNEDWDMGEYRGGGLWEWAKVGGEIYGILAGETVSGFSFKSHGLPTIVNAAFFGYERNEGTKLEFLPPYGEQDTDEIANSFDRVFSSLEATYPEKFEYVSAKTIGPTAPPLDFNPLSFLDYIIGMKHEASTLGWITNKGIEMSLDAKLEAAKKKLEQGQNSTAKNILNALINEIEAQGCETYEGCLKGKHLTPEAYALLKYNVQYLIERL
ncbi:MAG: hypothetical protein HY805_01310 [Nitrospirae bacterium]|nr:hypothetical protein [Nitrospirota bacterium]